MKLRNELIEYVKWHEMDKAEWTNSKIEKTVDVYLIFNEKQLQLNSVNQQSELVCEHTFGDEYLSVGKSLTLKKCETCGEVQTCG